MTLVEIRALVPVADCDLLPPPGLFWHRSVLHGQAHVARVLVHAFRLIEATDAFEETARLWAAVYLHDIARVHDGTSRSHGADAWARLADLPDVQNLFTRGGVRAGDFPAIQAAVTTHCCGEPTADHPHRRLMQLLKDADGLDRVRLGDLDPALLRHPEARGMIDFAERLCRATNDTIPPSGEDFDRLWPEALRLVATLSSRAAQGVSREDRA